MKLSWIQMNGLLLFALFLLASNPRGTFAGTRIVNCNSGQTIQNALDRALDGDMIVVSGNCTENIVVEKNRITLKGAPGATLTARDATVQTIAIHGQNVKLLHFSSLSGGSNIILVGRSGSAEIMNNTLENGLRAVLINQGAYAMIQGNVIQNNGNNGGITVRQSAAADISTNIITGNVGNGIRVDDAASVDIADNTITGNGDDAIFVRLTSHARLSVNGGPNLIEGNAGIGVVCQQNSSIRSGTSQNFGNGNVGGNTLFSGCTISGAVE